MKVLYFCVTGSSDPTRASIPFHVAVNGSAEVGQDATLVLGGDAAELAMPEISSKVEGLGLPRLEELLSKAKDRRLQVFV